MMCTRSQIRSACSIRWVENSTVLPARASSIRAARSTSVDTGSMPENGSSKKTISGSCTTAAMN